METFGNFNSMNLFEINHSLLRQFGPENRTLYSALAFGMPGIPCEVHHAHFDAGCGMAVDLITGQIHDFGGGTVLPPYSAYFWKMER